MSKEVFFEDSYILSETDSRGNITFASESFCTIAGYKIEELLGKPHNIVRHPDMPKAAFKMVWDSIATKGFWSGIVKNRCKNGDYYWVYAMILRNISKSGEVSYCSVRIKPSREQIANAEKLYATLK